ncbi:hypothetical protein G5714_006525 [Onychostoma macrolepis]|uniref:Secreted protein n=1 Tax=Onychostoma macrolepis TaxID=369639 RepID=A0A7J6D427_9TELE|nr:hypothetical protein G5714_006525 [Onychostoma macrolepis]
MGCVTGDIHRSRLYALLIGLHVLTGVSKTHGVLKPCGTDRQTEREMDQAGTDICSHLLFHLALHPPPFTAPPAVESKTEESGGVETLVPCVSGP